MHASTHKYASTLARRHGCRPRDDTAPGAIGSYSGAYCAAGTTVTETGKT